MSNKFSIGSLEELLYGNELNIDHREIWIWGVGATSSLYQEDICRLSKELGGIKGYCDNNSARWGEYCGLPVVSPEELKQKDDIIVLICSWQRNVLQIVGSQLTEMGKEWYCFDEFVLRLHRREVLSVFHMLEDDFSREVYTAMLWGRIYGGDGTARIVEAESLLSGNAYFDIPAFAKIDKDEVFIDCGAYVGDTVERYLFEKNGMMKRVIAFEPDEKSFAALKYRRERLLHEWGMEDDAIRIYPYAVGEKDGTAAFVSVEDTSRLSSRIEWGNKEMGMEVKVVSLDHFMDNPYSQIKIDVMGAEYDVLCGARNGIKEWMPNIAVCLSYGVLEVFQVPLLLKKLVPEYKLAVRHHRNNMCMTLYAWVD